MFTKREKIGDEDLFSLFDSDFEGYLACSKMSHQMPAAHRPGLSEKMLGKVTDMGIKIPCINTRPVILFSAKRLARHHFYWRSKPHQDQAIMMGSEDAIVVWLPLCEMSQELGFLEVVPGSHKDGVLKHTRNGPSLEIDQEIPDENFTPVEMRCGDALFFSSKLIHRSGTNISSKIRMTISYRFDDLSNEKFASSKFPLGFEYVMKQA